MTTSARSKPTMPPTGHTPTPYTGPSRQDVLAARRQYCNPGIFTIYREPMMVVEGHMQYLWDETGKRYLDMLGGIVTVSCGHSHPKFLARVKAQLDLIQHTTTIYLHPNLGDDGPEAGLEDAAGAGRHLFRQQRKRGQ